MKLTGYVTETLLIKSVIVVILLSHSLVGMFDGGIQAFGELYLNQVGFSPIGVPLAWAIKLSHIAAAILILLNRYSKPAIIVTIFILISGIFIIHFKEGWFVVSGGRNGMEYNFLLIIVLVSIYFQKPVEKRI